MCVCKWTTQKKSVLKLLQNYIIHILYGNFKIILSWFTVSRKLQIVTFIKINQLGCIRYKRYTSFFLLVQIFSTFCGVSPVAFLLSFISFFFITAIDLHRNFPMSRCFLRSLVQYFQYLQDCAVTFWSKHHILHQNY